MSRPARVALALAGLALIFVLFVVLRPDDDEESANATTSETTASTTTTTATPPPLRNVIPVRITFRDGRVVGGIQRPRVQRGDRVRVVVRADLADEVHLHGYDISRRVRPGAPTLIVFRATVAGQFEVELEERKVPLAEIEVRP